jgi:hypothetical protein
MSENQTDMRRATFFFVDGTTLTLELPKQAPKGLFALETALDNAITAPQLAVEVGGKLVVIQMANVKYIEVSPCPERLPERVLRSARQVD